MGALLVLAGGTFLSMIVVMTEKYTDKTDIYYKKLNDRKFRYRLRI